MYEVYVGREGARYGPFSEDQVRQMALDGRLVDTDVFWCAGMAQWESAAAILAAVGEEKPAGPPPLPAVLPTPARATALAPGRTQVARPRPAMPTARPPTERTAHDLGGNRPAAKVDTPAAGPQADDKPLSPTWQRRFERIERVVGPDMSLYPSLSVGKKLRLSLGLQGAGINLLAGILGPLYYLAKGMWRPAISRLLLLIVVNQLLLMLFGLDAKSSPWLIHGLGLTLSLLLLGGPANFHYYRKVKLGDKSWW